MYVFLLFSLLIPQIFFSLPADTHLLATSNTSKNTEEIIPNYYWREYSDKIPADAIIGGKDFNGDHVYIGQVYLKNAGLMIGQINPRSSEVSVTYNGVRKISKYIKILCGQPLESFVWIPTNATNIHLTLLNKYSIIGGHEDGWGNMNIGRISYEGGTQIGKIKSFVVGKAYFHWADLQGKDPGVNNYEVLVYQRPHVGEQ